MAVLSVQQVVQAGTVVAFTAATGGGDVIPTGPTNMLRVKNGGGSSITVTVTAVVPCSQGSLHNLVDTIAAGAEETIGPITDNFYNVGAGGAAVSYSGVTSVTVAAVKV